MCTRHLCSHIRFGGSPSTSPRCRRLHNTYSSSCPRRLIVCSFHKGMCFLFCLLSNCSFGFVGGARKRLFEQTTYFSRISTGQLHKLPLLRDLATGAIFKLLQAGDPRLHCTRASFDFRCSFSCPPLVRIILLNRRS